MKKLFLKTYRASLVESAIVKKYGKKNGGEGSYIRKLIRQGADDCDICGGTGDILEPNSDTSYPCRKCSSKKVDIAADMDDDS